MPSDLSYSLETTDGDSWIGLTRSGIAAWPEACGKGVLTVLNNEIQCALYVTNIQQLAE